MSNETASSSPHEPDLKSNREVAIVKFISQCNLLLHIPLMGSHIKFNKREASKECLANHSGYDPRIYIIPCNQFS